MFGLGAGEMILVGVIALIFIGPKKLPELARGLGQGLREFQKAKDDFKDNLKDNSPSKVLEDSQKVKLTAVLPTSTLDKMAETSVVSAAEKPEVNG
ncbi:MAG: twin-arginine translocase TatA/TatE family subunit [Bdellovibrio sp.]|nr:twin-arginine translocase TatA/TatE family subunit [Bdellovibrio sp.]